MEYQDYNDEFHRYAPEGYKKQIKEKLKRYNRIIRHQHNYRLENESQLKEAELRKEELELLENELKEKFHKMQLEHDERMKQEYEECELQPLEDLDPEHMSTIHTLMEYDNEIYGLKCEIRVLKLIIRSIDIQIDEINERKQKVKVAIC